MSENTVIAECLDKGYPDGRTRRQVLDDVSVEVPAGQIVGIRGPSGCGKTTLLTIIAGLLLPDRGRVVVAGHELDYAKPRDVARVRRQHVGVISQAYGLIHDESAVANITLPLMFDRPRPSRRSKAATVQRVMEQAALDVNPRTRVAKLSEGEKQRVAIARALVRQPSLLVADEPTAALDAGTGSHIVARLRSVADDGVGVLVATHDEQVADVCDVVHTFEATRLVRDPRPVDADA